MTRLRQLAAEDSPELFREFVEPLSDAFEPALCDRYADQFVPLIAELLPEAQPRRAPAPKPFHAPDPDDVFVLSRITLGADVAVTSVVMAAAAQRFPNARIHFTGPRKNHALFAGTQHVPIEYGGGVLARIQAALDLRPLLDRPRSIVIDPDSRLTQLGLIPVCPDDRYFFWDSRSYRPESQAALGALASEWMTETFGAAPAQPFLAPAEDPVVDGWTAVSLGVGGNLAKRVDDAFEAGLLRGLVGRGHALVIDHGAGGEESDRVHRAIESARAAPDKLQQWQGSFARFAATIAASRLYVGYDSAGQHVAAAAGVPVVTVFNGYPNERFRLRWTPSGSGQVRVVPGPDYLRQALDAVDDLSR